MNFFRLRHLVRLGRAFSLGLTVAFQPAAFADSTAHPDELAFFEASVRPILVEHCYSCHSAEAEKLEGGLRLDTRDGARAGGDTGPAVVPGDAARSLLLAAVRHDGLEMPPNEKLSDSDIDALERWIRSGAVDPREGGSELVAKPIDYEKGREFWSLQPVVDPRLPTVQETEWPQTSIDYFILSKLESLGLAHAPLADRIDLIRRATYDLTGLPPTIDEIDAFVHDHSPDAYERLIDRLLASPRYGERWGQHWLDVVRFAETEGFEYDRTVAGAWRYRDYVISAFNQGVCYHEFVREQMAGDELGPTDHSMLVAAGFHRLGAVRRNAGNQAVAASRNEVLTERTDIIGSAILGLTIGCARCHDHKFDPISQKDYYSLQAYFAASDEYEHPLIQQEEYAVWKERSTKLQKQIDQLKKDLPSLSGEEEERALARIKVLEGELPPPIPVISTVRNDFESETPIHVLKRGEWTMAGERVSPRPLEVLGADFVEEYRASQASPRTALAEWLTAANNPLTARVLVNRLWHYHFGRGLVFSPNDFGRNGRPPSHPELLDHLASRLIVGGWEIKPLHRLVLLSAAYQQASDSVDFEIARRIDPENASLWHFAKRRLSAEEIRDSMLAISGEINLAMGGPSVMLPVEKALIEELYKPSQWGVAADRNEHARRSIYLIAKRNLRLPFMEVFDQPTLQSSCSRRESSTHAPQALELLNGPISNQLAEAFAERLMREAGDDSMDRIRLAFRLAIGRYPTEKEAAIAREFLEQRSLREFALATFNLNSFLYVR